jgi:methionine biosynthesis protein MetW
MAAAAFPHHHLSGRPDFDAIADWVKPGARVLDLGCGDGSLLRFLRETREATGYGIEIDDAKVLASAHNGVNVIQLDLESGLSGFESGSFDYVVLSQTLQAVRHTERIIKEMLRVGREGIVAFPNFGYWRHRVQILAGRMPVSENLPYQWYDTPNVHLFTIRDFEQFCATHGVRILERKVISEGRAVTSLPNLLGSLAVYRLNSAG